MVLFSSAPSLLPVSQQASAMEWGALLWHLRLALAPAAGGDGFAATAPFERQLNERLWRESRVPLTSGIAGSGNGPSSGSCLCVGPLVSATGDAGSWGSQSPAALGLHVSHRLAREASRELVAIFCFQNAAAIAVMHRLLPFGISASYFTSRLHPQAGAKAINVSLLDANAASGVCDESMFTSPRARQLWPVMSAVSTGASGAAQSPQLTATLLATSLWSGDADVPVALGRSGCLWWDASLCSPAANKAQRLAVAARVKVVWLGVSPQVWFPSFSLYL
jgi:hypothetical protein